MKDAKKKIGIIVEGLEEISKIRANEYLGCNDRGFGENEIDFLNSQNVVSDEKKRNFVKFVKFIGEMKDVLNQ